MTPVPPERDRRPTTDDGGLPRPDRRIYLGLLAALLALVLFRSLGGAGGGGGILATSCAAPAVGLSSPTATTAAPIRFEITGPESWTYLAWVDAATSTGSPKDPAATPLHPGETPELVLPPLSLSGCRLTATHGLDPDVRPGAHTLVVFRVDPDGTQVEVASAPFTVVGPTPKP